MENEEKLSSNKELIVGLGKNYENNVVQLSNPLLPVTGKMNTLELGMFIVYLSRINSRNKEKRTVIISRHELEDALGISNIRPDRLKIAANFLRTLPVEFNESEDEIDIINLFSRAQVKKTNDDYQIELTCTEEAIPYIFKIEKLGYVKFTFGVMKKLKNQTAFCIFLYLESKRKLGLEWEETIDDFKSYIGLSNDKYKDYNDLKKRVLSPSQTKLKEKLGVEFDFEPVRVGMAYKKIRFKLKSKISLLDNEELILNEIQEDFDPNEYRDLIQKELEEENENKWVLGKLADLGFTKEERNAVYARLVQIGCSDTPYLVFPKSSTRDLAMNDYLEMKIKDMMIQDAKSTIKNKCKYLIGMIEKDMEKLEIL